MAFARALALTFLFLLVLGTVYVVHVLYFPVRVILYDAVLDVVIAAVFGVALLLGLRRHFSFTSLEQILLVSVWLLTGYALAISGPTVLDRSLSIYILEKLQQRGGGIRVDAIPEIFVREYMPEYRLVDVRLTEQIESGTVVIVDGCVRLTPLGERIAAVSRFLHTHLLARKRLLAGRYTDALVDPLSASEKGPQGYECR